MTDVREDVSAEAGSRIRDMRLAVGLTLGDLAQSAGMSKAHLSRLESGERGFTLANLINIASHLGVSAAALIPGPTPTHSDVVASDGPVVRASDLDVRPLTRRTDARLQPFRVVVPAERTWAAGSTHAGEEWIYVLRGRVTIVHGANSDTLNPGDSIHLDATEPHRISAESEAELLVVTERPS